MPSRKSSGGPDATPVQIKRPTWANVTIVLVALFVLVWMLVSMKMFFDQRNTIIAQDRKQQELLERSLPVIDRAREDIPETRRLIDAGVPLVETLSGPRVRSAVRSAGRALAAATSDDKLPRLLAASVNIVERASETDLLGRTANLVGQASHTVDYTHDVLTQFDESGLIERVSSAAADAELLLRQLRDRHVAERLERAGIDVRRLRNVAEDTLSIQRRTLIILTRSLVVQQATLRRIESLDARLGGAPPSSSPPAATAAAAGRTDERDPAPATVANPAPGASHRLPADVLEDLPPEVRELLPR